MGYSSLTIKTLPSPSHTHTFFVAKIKKEGSKGKKEFQRQKLLKGKVYCFRNVCCFILERLEFKSFSLFHGPSTFKSISPALLNLALTCAAHHQKLICLGCVLGAIFSCVFIGF